MRRAIARRDQCRSSASIDSSGATGSGAAGSAGPAATWVSITPPALTSGASAMRDTRRGGDHHDERERAARGGRACPRVRDLPRRCR